MINLDGSEVSFTGEIGYNRGSISGGPQLYIKTDAMSSFISGDAALNREQLASIQECELRGTRCTADIKAELKADLIILLAENGYPPVDRDEVYTEIFEQAENFKKYNQ